MAQFGTLCHLRISHSFAFFSNQSSRKILFFKPEEIKVYLGVHNVIDRQRSKHVQMSYAKLVVPNPKFDHALLDNDIGLIELATPAKLNGKGLKIVEILMCMV